jgi:DNA helicase HerA-like ATPase
MVWSPSDRHRQDGDITECWRFRTRGVCAGFRGRRKGRLVRHWALQRARLSGQTRTDQVDSNIESTISGGVLGLFGEQGHPIRTTVFEMGPLLLSRMLDLNDVQEGIINIAFRFADDKFGSSDVESKGLIDLKDLRELLSYLSKNSKEIGEKYGNVATATVGSVQRQLLVLENQGGEKFFGEPALALKDFIRSDRDGRGFVNILAADKLMEKPRLYATFLFGSLRAVRGLPEAGDWKKPVLFDEAHLSS